MTMVECQDTQHGEGVARVELAQDHHGGKGTFKLDIKEWINLT